MDFFQGVVTEFLRADRAAFVNTEYLIQLDTGNAPAKGRHWYCDAVTVNFRDQSIYLCEITYSTTLSSLLGRLQAWAANWGAIRVSLVRDSDLPASWNVQPWVFIPQNSEGRLRERLAKQLPPQADAACMPLPRVTHLESVTPWRYRSWDRRDDALAGSPEA